MTSFQSTCPARGTTAHCTECWTAHNYFNPRAPRGARLRVIKRQSKAGNFNPRAPRGARQKGRSARTWSAGISIHVPREGHDKSIRHIGNCKLISIHVPREGHDGQRPKKPCRAGRISIHVPREGHDLDMPLWVSIDQISIHVPREGHDCHSPTTSAAQYYFNPRAPRGARLAVMMDEEAAGIFQSTCPARGTTVTDLISDLRKIISIHVPREGHDLLTHF